MSYAGRSVPLSVTRGQFQTQGPNLLSQTHLHPISPVAHSALQHVHTHLGAISQMLPVLSDLLGLYSNCLL